MSRSLDPAKVPGSIIGGRYLVERALGRGGMAAVYRVRDTRTGQTLALKNSRGTRTAKDLRRRASLEREFQTLAHLKHPRIIEVFDYGVGEQGPFYTMELLDGADLDKAGRMPWQKACALLRDIASSLAIMHSRGLIHRDVSARNVRRTADGRAKLIDFGAMASIGVVSEVLGTPPFMAPEVLQMQALDARADLFSLGALGYYLLTGRHAFAARRLGDLRDAWRSRPVPPSRLAPEVPQPLSRLILQLLSLDRSGRPQSAAEIMERLCAIAALPVEELGEISRAYLATPTLVGREHAQVGIRSQMLSLLRGDGGTLVITGASGSGRSRLLDVCVLEGKLMGASVVRADPGDSVLDWGVARAIGTQLFELFPTQADEVTRLSRDVLGHVIDEVRRESSTSVSMSLPERSLILRELRDFVLAMTRGQRLLIAVDDVDRIDEPSAALLAAIADKSERHSLILALTLEQGAAHAGSPSMQLLSSIGHHVQAEPLDREQTEALMRSVFGDAANLPLCAARIHEVAQGNARTTMELLQDLVDTRVLRYEAGSWLIPPQLRAVNLPSTLAASLVARVQRLNPDARELANALCLAEGCPLTLHSYRALTSHRDRERVFRAIQELVAARVLVAANDSYRFSQHGFVTVLQDIMPKAQRIALHGRLATLLASSGGDPLRRAHHLLQAEREAEAIALLRSVDLVARMPPLPLLEAAIEYAEHNPNNIAMRTLHQMRMALLIKAPLVGAAASFRRWLPSVLTQLETDSGLALYRELTELPDPERLGQAVARQQQQFLQTPEDQRVYTVGDAIRELARLCGAAANMAVLHLDLELLESLPSVEPLLPLSPALQVLDCLVRASNDWVRGRSDSARALYEETLERIAQPDRAGLDELQYERVRLGVHYALALVEANQGSEGAEERAAILETQRGMRVSAWRVRMLLRANQGDMLGARKCQRRAELLQLQEGGESYYIGSTATFEVNSSSLAGDLLGVKTALDALSVMAEQRSGWRPMLLLGQSRYRELQGDRAGALEVARAGLQLAPAGRHVAFPMLAASEVRLLRELGRVDEAVELGQRHVQACERQALQSTDRHLRAELAEALAAAGQHAPARASIASLIAAARADGATGLALGCFYEKAARIALHARDRDAFDAFCEDCAQHYRKGSGVLAARLSQLLDDASQQRVQPSETARLLTESLLSSQTDSQRDVVHGRLSECVDRSDRARTALTMLLQNAESFQGYLYAVNDEHLSPLAGLPELIADPGLDAWLQTWVRAEREQDSAVTSQIAITARTRGPALRSRPPTGDSGMPSWPADTTCSAESEDANPIPNEYIDHEGRRFRAALLTGEHRGEPLIAAVLALHTVSSSARVPASGLRTDIARYLLESRDVVGTPLTPR